MFRGKSIPYQMFFAAMAAFLCAFATGESATASDELIAFGELQVPDSRVGTVMPATLTRPVNSSVEDFTAHNVVHVLYHEAGHAVIDQFQLAVIGQEEDAADSFATYSIAELYEDPLPILIDAAEAMFIAHEVYGVKRSDYFGEHDLDIQRAFRLLCQTYGLDPIANAKAGEQVQLDQDQEYKCERDAIVMRDSWDALLDEDIPDEGEPLATVNIAVANTDEFNWERDLILQHPLIQDFIADMEDGFRWPEPVSIVFAECDEANAFYDPDLVEITMCYEFIREMAEFAKSRK